jgi:DNA-binding protein H-NS
MDLRKLSPAELDELITRARKRQDALASQKIPKVRARIEAILKAEGLTLADVFSLKLPAGAAPAAKARKPGKAAAGPNAGRKVAPKYRNPADPSQTWAGRGAQPRWFREALAAGSVADDLLIR